MKHFLTIILILFCFFTKAQTDTVIKKIHYNHVEYYQDPKIKSIGNIKDSLKIGEWIYFKPNGSILAKGKYLNGKKTGKWKYIDYENKKHSLKWDRNEQTKESFKIENGQLNIYDETKIPSGAKFIYTKYANGKLDECLLY